MIDLDRLDVFRWIYDIEVNFIENKKTKYSQN